MIDGVSSSLAKNKKYIDLIGRLFKSYEYRDIVPVIWASLTNQRPLPPSPRRFIVGLVGCTIFSVDAQPMHVAPYKVLSSHAQYDSSTVYSINIVLCNTKNNNNVITIIIVRS